ncbi:XdhC family protein [Christensenellaceae bacterium OttesenSCG-928-M15]|nr:XdhC family protein [Christensenellaceae bacterium OttesenSCG-928-M15]
MLSIKKLYVRLLEELQMGRPAVLVTVLQARGVTPRGAGAKMLVLSNDEIEGTVGGGLAEHEAFLDAQAVLTSGCSQIRTYLITQGEQKGAPREGGEITVALQHYAPVQETLSIIESIVAQTGKNEKSYLVHRIYDDEDFDISIFTQDGGAWPPMRMPPQVFDAIMKDEPAHLYENDWFYVEPLVRCSTVYVFGGGHVARAVVPVVAQLDFRVVVYEDRAELAKPSFFPSADQVILCAYDRLTDTLSLNEEDCAVVMTKSPECDFEVLKSILPMPAGYIGMIGSQQKTALTKKRLLEEGPFAEAFNRVKTPIGLDIGAETPAEIAISIAAELIAVRHGKKTTF